jgi:hypothetical protein
VGLGKKNKINFEKYNFCLKNIVLILFFVILLFYSDLLFYSLESYEANIAISNEGLYNYLKYLFIILLSLLLSQEKKIFNYILFFFIVTIFSFFTSDRNPFLILFSVAFFYFFHKKNFKNLNLLSISLILNSLLYIFNPFFGYYRKLRTFSGFYDWFIAQNYNFLGDAGTVLLSIILIAENNVNLEINFFYNLISFLPRYIRELFNYQDVAVEFAKIVLKENYVGQGFGFSIVAESYLYLKKGLFAFIFFVVFLGFVYIFFIQIISKKLVPHKLSFYIITVTSVLSSFSAIRTSSAGLFLFSFRFLILFLIIYIIYILFKNLLHIKYRI